MSAYREGRKDAQEEKLGLLDEVVSSSSEFEGENEKFEAKHEFPLHVARFSTILSKLFRCARTIPCRSLLIRFLIFMTPSFLQGRHARDQIRPAKIYPTAYLDGMRGLAALVVFFCHYSYQSFTIAKGWGAEGAHYQYLKLPFLRLWYQGPPAVCLFFVISGYALSYRPLKFARSRSITEFSNTVSSLVFRRALRLYLPTIISTFMVVCLLRIGAYEWTREFAGDKKYMKNIVEHHPKRMDSAYDQWMDWVWHMFKFIHVFGWQQYGGSTTYDVHLWTIPVEFRCSLYLFLVIIGTARLRSIYRVFTALTVMGVSYRNSRWELVLFLCGFLLAELDLSRGAHVPSTSSTLPVQERGTQSKNPRLWKFFIAAMSIAGLFFMCQPDDKADTTPGWIYLNSIIPEWWGEARYRYWQSFGAIIFTWAVGYSKSWQWFFSTGVVQYFGKISYALYLMHGPVMHCIGYHFEKWAWGVTGVEGYWYNTGFFLGSVFCIPSVIWAADVFWRAVDVPTVKFAKWVESKLIVKD